MPALQIYAYTLPLTMPLELSSGTLTERRGMLLRLRTEDGSEGWGEAAPLPGFSRETFEEVRQQCLQLADASQQEATLDHASLLPCVRYAFESALLDAQARSSGKPLHRLMNPDARSTIVTNALLTGSPDDIRRDAARLKSEGYLAVKLKLGRRPIEEDVALVHDVSETLGQGTFLLLDANRAWTFEEARSFAEQTSGRTIAYVEEPLRDPERLEELSAHLPIALDETLASLGPDEDLSAYAFACGAVLKPMLLGGVTRAWQLAAEAQRHSMTISVSAAFESGIGTRMLLALAAGFPDALAGVAPYARLKQDLLVRRLDLQMPTLNADTLLADPPDVDHEQLERP